MIPIDVTIDGRACSLDVEPGATLLEALRAAGHTSVKDGCSSGDCGACAVLLNGLVVNSCFTFAAQVDGRSVETVASLARDGELHPLQRAFLDAGAVQCGYCTPGMLLAATDLIARNDRPSEAEVRGALAGTLCRCTGFVKPVEAILRAADEISRGDHG
ncbi:MAG: (2Fe-2S)-binding protein [Acidimicrobiia bacterium]